MSTPEDRMAQLGLVLPAALRMPPGVTLPFPWVRVVGRRALISRPRADRCRRQPGAAPGQGGAGGHPRNKAFIAARLAGLAILGSSKRELGALSRIACWSRVFGMVDSAPGFACQPAASTASPSSSSTCYFRAGTRRHAPQRGRHG